MEKFRILRGVAVPFMRSNIDTDAIAPARFGRDIKSNETLGEKLFFEWRYKPDGTDDPDFILNQPRYRKSQILVTGENFGCGSSRERAVWALMKFGFKCVIAPSYGEIFLENCYQNGMPPIVLSKPDVEAICEQLHSAESPKLTVNLEECCIDLPDHGSISFSMPVERRTSLLEGLDELGLLQRYQNELSAFQEKDRAERSWIYGR